MKSITSPKTSAARRSCIQSISTFAVATALFSASFADTLLSQTPETFATGLNAPSKIIQTPRGNFIVAEAGVPVPNNGRVSIVDEAGNRRTLLGKI